MGWASQIYSYVKAKGVFTCPDDTVTPTSASYTEVSYAYKTGNAQNNGTNPRTTQQSCAYTGTSPCISTMWVTSKYNSPARTILLTEFRMPPGTGAPISSSESVNDTAGTASPTIPFGASNAYCRTDANCQGGPSNSFGGVVTGIIGGNTTQTYSYLGATNVPPVVGALAYTGLHSAGSNFLFFDGHVKWLNGSAVSSGGNNATEGACGNGTSQGANTDCGTYTGTYSIL